MGGSVHAEHRAWVLLLLTKLEQCSGQQPSSCPTLQGVTQRSESESSRVGTPHGTAFAALKTFTASPCKCSSESSEHLHVNVCSLCAREQGSAASADAVLPEG